MKKDYENFSFLHDIVLKQIYVVIFTSVSLVNICQLHWMYECFLDPQCIVRQGDFQHKLPNWSTLFPLLSFHTSRAEKGRQKP